jgi:hypothetical protein
MKAAVAVVSGCRQWVQAVGSEFREPSRMGSLWGVWSSQESHKRTTNLMGAGQILGAGGSDSGLEQRLECAMGAQNLVGVGSVEPQCFNCQEGKN